MIRILGRLGLLRRLGIIDLTGGERRVFLPKSSRPLAARTRRPNIRLLHHLQSRTRHFTIDFRHRGHARQVQQSHLSSVPNLNRRHRGRLLTTFHSVSCVQRTDPRRLTAIPNVNPRLTRAVCRCFRPRTRTDRRISTSTWVDPRID